MRNKYPRTKLSHEEEVFLRHWIYDEWHYQKGQGPPKRLQLEHMVVPANLALLIAAAMPNSGEQESAAEVHLPESRQFGRGQIALAPSG